MIIITVIVVIIVIQPKWFQCEGLLLGLAAAITEQSQRAKRKTSAGKTF